MTKLDALTMDDRNFRSIYYGKVGFKGIEEKKSLEIILKEEPIDSFKLSHFCLKFPVPCGFRFFIWQVSLGVLPVHQSIHTNAFEQRKLQFQELKHALLVMRKIDDKTPRELVFLKMYLIEEKNLPFENDDSKLMKEHASFYQICKIICELVLDDVRAFWLALKLTIYVEKGLSKHRSLASEIETILNREDHDYCLFLMKHQLLSTLPLRSLFSSAFASIFPDDFLERIWDRLIGGSHAYLCYVFVAVLLVMKRQVLSTERVDQINEGVSADYSELVLSMATDLWSKDGCPLNNP